MPTWDTERYRPVKSELRAILMDRRWHSHQEVIKKLLAAGDLAPRTCSNLLRELVKDWKIETKGAYRPGGPGGTDTRAYRLVDQGAVEAVTAAESVAAIDRDLRRLERRRRHQNDRLGEIVAGVARLTEEIEALKEMKRIMGGNTPADYDPWSTK